MTKMRSFLAIIAIVALAACSPKPPSPVGTGTPTVAIPTPTSASVNPGWARVEEAAQKEGAVTIVSGAYFDSRSTDAVQKVFKTKYGISINVVTGSGPQGNERVTAEMRSGQHLSDLFVTAPSYFVSLQRNGYSLPFGDLPVLKERGVWQIEPVRGPDIHALRASIYLQAPTVNTTLVGPEKYPKSWSDLLKPEWKGKMSIVNPRTGSALSVMYTWMKNHKIVDNADAYFQQLGKQNFHFVLNESERGAALSRGDSAMDPWAATVTMGQVAAQGAPVKMLPVSEGFNLSSNDIAILRDGPNPNATRLFLNWLLSKEGQTVYSEARGSVPIRKDVRDFRPPALQFPLDNAVPFTREDQVDADKYFSEGYVLQFFGLKK